jgi:NAD(P)-dependent dehydrogenase (short-subunit alcohol dehydrogenase family)
MACRVNAMSPAYVPTRWSKADFPDRQGAWHDVVKNLPLQAPPTRRFVTTAAIDALAVFLRSDGAAPITRAWIPVDGGRIAQ